VRDASIRAKQEYYTPAFAPVIPASPALKAALAPGERELAGPLDRGRGDVAARCNAWQQDRDAKLQARLEESLDMQARIDEGALSFATPLCSSYRDSPYKREWGGKCQ
jgi:hypothetical protein